MRSTRGTGLLCAGALLLLAASGCGSGSRHAGGSGPATTGPATAVSSDRPAVERAGKLELEADRDGQLAYTTNRAVARAGRVRIAMRNMSGVMHNVAIQSGTSGAVLGHSELQADGTSSFTVQLRPGTYTFFCQAPGHRAAGMYGTLTVR
jgi:plastocyanin